MFSIKENLLLQVSQLLSECCIWVKGLGSLLLAFLWTSSFHTHCRISYLGQKRPHQVQASVQSLASAEFRPHCLRLCQLGLENPRAQRFPGQLVSVLHDPHSPPPLSFDERCAHWLLPQHPGAPSSLLAGMFWHEEGYNLGLRVTEKP